MTATGSPSHRRDDCRPRSFSIGRAGGTTSPGRSLSLLPSFLLTLLINTDGADSKPYHSVRVCSLEKIPTDECQLTAVKRSLRPGTDKLQFENWKPRTFEPTQNAITPDRREMTFESYLSRKRAIVETIRIGRTSADMHVLEMH